MTPNLIPAVYDVPNDTAEDAPVRASRTTRKGPEATAWILWILTFLVGFVLPCRAMSTPELTLDERAICVIQFVTIAWLIFVPSVYFWRRGDGHGHLNGLAWFLVTATIPLGFIAVAVLATPIGFSEVWNTLYRPIPFSTIF